MIIIPIKWLFHWEYTLLSDKPKYNERKPLQIEKKATGARY
jgi:hypothetical protein